MIKILDSKKKNFDIILDRLLSERKDKIELSSVSVTKIIKDVKKNGDKAVLKYERKFNKNNKIVPNSKKINKSVKSLDLKVKRAIDLAYNRIYKFHSLQKFKDISYTDKLKNKLEYKYVPIDSVAIYVPGSTVSYPSSVLMNAIPAIVAGVKRLVMINPGYKGKQNSATLYAAKKCKVKEIYSIGGPSAIAAVAYGTKKIKKVNKIVGPGNSYVTQAKKEDIPAINESLTDKKVKPNTVKETKTKPKRKVEKLEKVDLSKVGLKLVETKASLKSKNTKTKLSEKKEVKTKKKASWQNQPKKKVGNTKLVMVETKKEVKTKKIKKTSPSKK